MGKGTVLVVDDDPAILDFIEAALSDAGYWVLSGVDGDALHLAHTFLPGMILLDIQMPLMDGVEISRRLRAGARTAAIPIIAMSTTDRLAATAGSMAADDQLAKPFSLATLYATVAQWCRPA